MEVVRVLKMGSQRVDIHRRKESVNPFKLAGRKLITL
jgi:hypothetical protein